MTKLFTEKQGQYLAFIYAYSRISRRPPAEADMQRHFQVAPPTVHQMVLTLERTGLIRRPTLRIERRRRCRRRGRQNGSSRRCTPQWGWPELPSVPNPGEQRLRSSPD